MFHPEVAQNCRELRQSPSRVTVADRAGCAFGLQPILSDAAHAVFADVFDDLMDTSGGNDSRDFDQAVGCRSGSGIASTRFCHCPSTSFPAQRCWVSVFFSRISLNASMDQVNFRLRCSGFEFSRGTSIPHLWLHEHTTLEKTTER
jgi:hypothetical protein